MERKWLFIIVLLAGIILTGCGDDVVAMPTGLFMPQADLNTSALCTITMTDVKVVSQGTPPKAALIMQGSVGAYCGQLEIKMLPMDGDEVRIIVIAAPPANEPTAAEMAKSRPVFVNMTLDTLSAGRYQLFVNGTKYQVFSTP